MSGLRLVSLRLANTGVLRGELDLGTFDERITLITGENEAGKSTTVKALRCALFERHSAGHAGIKELQPYNSNLSPEVWVEFELDGRRHRLHKRFLKACMCELRIGETEIYAGAEADQKVWELLGSSAPGTRGAKDQDMGLWGLLWVSQDAGAYADPGTRIGDETRGALQEAIGRQVGSIIGGARGELIRTRAMEERGRYWTPSWKPTGELVRAREGLERTEQEVQKIQAAVDQVQDEATRYEGLGAQLEELGQVRPRLKGEAVRAVKAAAGLAELKGKVDKAAQQVEVVCAREEAAAGKVDTRQEIGESVARLQKKRDRTETELKEMGITLADQERRLKQSSADLLSQRDEEARTRDEKKGLEEALDQGRRREEAARLKLRLTRAEKLTKELEELRRAEAERLDDESYQALKELDGRRSELTAQLAVEGTRLVVEWPDERAAFRCAVGLTREVEVPELGVVTLTPARPGLARAVGRLGEVRASLEEALGGAGLEGMAEARRRRGRREELEGILEERAREGAELVPEGVEALAESVAGARRALQAAEATLTRGESQAAKLGQLKEELAGVRVDEAAADGLEGLWREVELSRERREVASTGLELEALSKVSVSRDGEESRSLEPGEERRWRFSQPGILTVGDLARVKVVPGGEGMEEIEQRVRRGEAALGEALAAVGARDLAEARALGRRWRELQTIIRDAEDALEEIAPTGIEALRGDLRVQREQLGQDEERLVRARELFKIAEEAAREQAENPVTEELLERLQNLEKEVQKAQGMVVSTAARVHLGGQDAGEEIIAERRGGDLPGGGRWEVVPGEDGEETDAALTRVRDELEDALSRIGVTDLEQATARWRLGVKTAEQVASRREQLGEAAPEGVEALQEAVRQAGKLVSKGGEDPPDLPGLEGQLKELEERLSAQVKLVEEARGLVGRDGTARAELEGQVGMKRRELDTLGRDLEDASARLESARQEAGDMALEELLATLKGELKEARAQLAADSARFEDAGPQLLDGEVERAERALEANNTRTHELEQKQAAAKALLERAAAEGRFEDLAEAEVELEQARLKAARVERDAEAARRLAEEIERAYAVAQKRFLAPVIKEAKPYLQAVRPGTDIKMTADLEVASVVRRGAEEQFDELSGGTKEQLSVIVRLALARVLARDSECQPLPLILDDTMGWTDERRFVEMAKILRNAARQFQIIVLTCHPWRFERLDPGRKIDLDALKRSAAEAEA